VQQPVDQVERHFTRIAGIFPGGALAQRGIDADDQLHRRFAGKQRIGVVEVAEGDDVGRPLMSDVLPVGDGHGAVADETDVELPVEIVRESGEHGGALNETTQFFFLRAGQAADLPRAVRCDHVFSPADRRCARVSCLPGY